MKLNYIFIRNIIFILFIFPLFGTIFSAKVMLAKPGKKLPRFEIHTRGGKVIRNKFIREKAVVFIFWSQGSTKSRKALEYFDDMQKLHIKENFLVFALNIKDPNSVTAVDYLRQKKKYSLTFTVNNELIEQGWRIHQTPTIMVVDSKGIIRYRESDFKSDKDEHDKLNTLITDLIKECSHKQSSDKKAKTNQTSKFKSKS